MIMWVKCLYIVKIDFMTLDSVLQLKFNINDKVIKTVILTVW